MKITKVSFEEACLISRGLVTAEAFAASGVPVVMERYRVALAEVGWTTGELADESRRRMHARIALLMMQEEQERKETP